MLSAKRIAWTFVSAFAATNDQGMLIDMETDSPQFVKDEVTNNVRRAVAKELDTALPMLRSGGNGPIMSGFGKIFKRNKKLHLNHTLWKNEYAASVRSAACNGQWPQSRLHSAGLVVSPNCMLCGASQGTLGHRHHCPTTVEARGVSVADDTHNAWWNKLSKAALHLMETRGLVACPSISNCKPSVEVNITWPILPAG